MEAREKLRKGETELKDKKDWIKGSFWVPEMTPHVIEGLGTKPTTDCVCPAETHPIKLKELVGLELAERDEEFICSLCKKALNHQKIGFLKRCGHVFCIACIDSYCLKDKKCGECGKEAKRKHVISLKESGTSYADHNDVVSK